VACRMPTQVLIQLVPVFRLIPGHLRVAQVTSLAGREMSIVSGAFTNDHAHTQQMSVETGKGALGRRTLRN